MVAVQVHEYLDQKQTAAMQERIKSRAREIVQEKGVSLDEALRLAEPPKDLQRKAEAMALADTIIGLSRTAASAGQMIIAAFWKMWLNRYHVELEYESIIEWINDELTGDTSIDLDYVKALAMVVHRIFPYVWKREQEGHPITDEETGVVITVEYLLETKGIISKLKAYSKHFTGLDEDSDKEKLIAAIGTKTRTQVKSVADEQKRKRVQVIIKATESKVVGENGKDMIQLSFNPIVVTQEQYDYILKRLGKMLEIG